MSDAILKCRHSRDIDGLCTAKCRMQRKFSFTACPLGGLRSSRSKINLSEVMSPEMLSYRIGHFTVMDGSEAEGDLVLIQTFFALLWKLFLKNNS